MSKPDDIPQDVWDAATGAVGIAFFSFDHAKRRTARAIIAERERCVQVALSFVKHHGDPGAVAINPYVDARDIAAAIRKGAQ